MAKVNWKKAVQAGALVTDALSKGSAGGLGKALVQSEIDLSGKDTTGNTTEKKTNGKFKKNGKERNVQIENGDSRLKVNGTDWPPKSWIA